MSNVCRICLEDTASGDAYHERCLRELTGSAVVPQVDLETERLHTAALAMVGHTSLSGVQKKISVGFARKNRETLYVMASGGHYILKPQTDVFPFVPENEHVTTLLAKLAGIEIAPNGLVSLKDGKQAYLVRRFDRLVDGRKRYQEDFCQLAEQAPKDKYEGSIELCVRLLRRFTDEPLIEIIKLYRLVLFAWWSGNGDMHLKNLSVTRDEGGIVKLTPAYDLLCTRLLMPDDVFALTIAGKKDKLRRKDWLELAKYCTLPERVAESILRAQAEALEKSLELIERSFLPPDQKEAYKELVVKRSDVIQ